MDDIAYHPPLDLTEFAKRPFHIKEGIMTIWGLFLYEIVLLALGVLLFMILITYAGFLLSQGSGYQGLFYPFSDSTFYDGLSRHPKGKNRQERC